MDNKILIIKPGDTFTDLKKRRESFDKWIAQKMELSSEEYHVCHWPSQEVSPDLNYAGVIITGAHSMVTEDPFIPALSCWLLDFHKTGRPILGICYGHQLLGHVFGGRVDYHPKGIEIGSVRIKRSAESKNDPLFRGIEEEFYEFVTHSQSVIRLPPSAQLLAGNGFEPHQSFRIGDNCWGVQFHPEFDHEIIKEYILRQKEKIAEANLDLDQLLDVEDVVDIGEVFLKNFRNIVHTGLRD